MSFESPPISIPATVLAQIYRHAREAFPNEACGYLRGADDALEFVPCRNRQDQLHALDPVEHPRTAANGYNIGGRELIDLVRSFETDHPVRIIYHSHPRVGAYFSDEDTRAAIAAGYPVDYLVVDVQDEEIREAVLFRRAAAGATFVAVARFAGERI